jgi:NAD+ synthase (glutamine-hydrolysing)
MRRRIVLAQLGFRVGDVSFNARRIIAAAIEARDRLRADCIVFPELALTGYPPEDLLLRSDFNQRVEEGLTRIAAEVRGIAIVIGHPQLHGEQRYNAATLLRDGVRLESYHKQLLPNYGVFDEKRYFTAGSTPCVVDVGGMAVGLTICEDIWQPGPAQQAVAAGAHIIFNINASPYHAGKRLEREAVLRARVAAGRVPVLYVNTVAGQDDLVFDGESFVMNVAGEVTQRAPTFEEALLAVDLDVDAAGRVTPLAGAIAPALDEDESIYRALVFGVREYIEKNGFAGVMLGLSGGIDSAHTLAIAVDALGVKRVEAVMMPSRYTASMSCEDAQAEAHALGVAYSEISIEPAFEAFLGSLRGAFAGLAPDVTEENLQARCRGVMLMAIANKKRRIVLITGNKSEMAVGYSTLYGDMAGGFAPLKDVLKTLVYRLARYRNVIAPVIPQRVLERAPSAELAPCQRDEDTLPPYPVLDAILAMYVEQDRSPEEIIAAGFDAEEVRKTVSMIERSEYKRRQAPPGVRVSRRAFGRDRRYPMTSGFSTPDFGEQ